MASFREQKSIGHVETLIRTPFLKQQHKSPAGIKTPMCPYLTMSFVVVKVKLKGNNLSYMVRRPCRNHVLANWQNGG